MSKITDITRYKEAKDKLPAVETLLKELDIFTNALYNNEIGWPSQIWRVLEESESLRIELLIQQDQYKFILNHSNLFCLRNKKKEEL